MTGDRKAMPLAWIITIMMWVPLLCSLPRFFSYVDQQQGSRPYEPFLSHIPAADISAPLFLVLYTAFAIVVVQLHRHPVRMLRGLQAAFILLVIRMITMYLVPLVPPPGLIPLQDPCLQIFYPSTQPFEKDLFFSGHTANVFLFFLAVPEVKWKRVLLIASVLVGSAVLVQHVHWTVDVVAAPFAALFAWKLSRFTIAASLHSMGIPSVSSEGLDATFGKVG